MISTSLTPPAPSPPAVRRGEVVANERIAPAVVRLRLRFDPPPQATPGQFVHLLCDTVADDVTGLPLRENHGPTQWRFTGFELLEPHPFLRRPISISRIYPDGLEMIYQVLEEGLGTPRLAQLGAGHTVDCLGPLGHGFTFHDGLRVALLVGGGVGIPPMVATGEWLHQRGVDCHAIAAARRRDLLATELREDGGRVRSADFDAVEVPVQFATDDGSVGHRGLVSEPLAEHLAALRDVPGVEVFACGPRPMLAAVAALAAQWERPCQVLMEEVMGCGIGVCLACVTKVKAAAAPGYVYKRVCTEGPAFNAEQVVWE